MIGVQRWPLWAALAWRDVRGRYRRTVLGPFWTVLTSAVMIAALGTVYPFLWGIDVKNFLPYFSAGYLTWILITTNVNESCVALIHSESVIRSLPIPYSVFIFRILLRNLIVFMHGMVAHAVVILAFGTPVGWSLLLAPVGLLLLTINCFWLGLLLSVVCARFRDVLQIITHLIQILFLTTPVIWTAEQLAGQPLLKTLLVDVSPLYHLIDVVRAPLIGAVPSTASYTYMVVSAVLGSAFAVTLFRRYYVRLAYWV